MPIGFMASTRCNEAPMILQTIGVVLQTLEHHWAASRKGACHELQGWQVTAINPLSHVKNRGRGRSPDVLAGVVGGVDAAQHQLAAGALGVVAVQPEGEYRLRHQALVHHVLEGGRRASDADLRERKPLYPT